MTAIGSAPWIQALGWTLVQFLWQGTVIWALFAVVRALTRRRLGPHARYAMTCAALGLMAAAPVWTLYEQLGAPLVPAWTMWSPETWRLALPWLVAAWMGGVLVFCWRLIDGWRAASRLRSLGTGPAPAEWRRILDTLAERAGIARPVRLLTSTLIEIPVVIGWWRPVILAPAAMLAGLPPRYLESMLAHELAHVRRVDYLVNLLQGVVEAVLFYHPAVWWISRELRAERERCCDDEAVALVGDVFAYANALAELESRRPAHRQALAANGGSLVDRIRLLLGQGPAVDAMPGAGVVAAMSAVWLIGVGAAGAHAAPLVFPIRSTPQLEATTRAIVPSPRPALSSLLFAPIGPKAEAPQTPEATAKPADSAVVVGRVVDADSGAPVPGAVVELRVSGPHSPAGGSVDYVINNVQSQGGFFVIGGPGTKTTSVLTGGDGQFAFRNVSAGRLDFSVTANGYSGGAYHQLRPDGSGQSLDIDNGQRVTDIALKMWKNGAISGRITDEAGEPVVGARVQVMRRSPTARQWTLIVGPNAHQTDDRGLYRVSGLLPGDYLIAVPLTHQTAPVSRTGDSLATSPPAAGRGAPAQGGFTSGQLLGNVLVRTLNRGGDSDALGPLGAIGSDRDGRLTAYATTSYPAASISSHATTVTVKSAEEKAGIDIQLVATHAFRLSGTLVDLDGSPAASLAIHLVPVDDQNNADTAAEDAATTVSGPRGEFTLAGVPTGQYQLTVLRSAPIAGGRGGRGAGAVVTPPTGLAAQTAWARQTVSVGDADIADLKIALRPAVTVTGRVVFDGAATQPTGAQLQRGIRAQPVTPGLRGGNGRGGGGPMAPIVALLSSDGSFAMTGLTPGAYQFFAPGWPLLKWTPKSVLVAGRDVSDTTVDIDSDIGNVVVTFTDRPGVLTGAVHRASGEPDTSALVVGFPTDSHAPDGSGMHMFTQRVETDGTYTVPALAPGDYNVVAIPDEFAQNWQEPAILQKLIPLAIRVRVDDGIHLKQDLTTSVVR